MQATIMEEEMKSLTEKQAMLMKWSQYLGACCWDIWISKDKEKISYKHPSTKNQIIGAEKNEVGLGI